MVLLQVGDLFSTRRAFAHGAVELNPVVHLFGLWQAKLLAVGAMALLVNRARKLRRLWTVMVIYGCIVGWNMLLVAKAR